MFKLWKHKKQEEILLAGDVIIAEGIGHAEITETIDNEFAWIKRLNWYDQPETIIHISDVTKVLYLKFD